MSSEGNGEDGLNVACRIILLLAPCARYENERFCPKDMTQNGIAERLRVPRSVVARHLGVHLVDGNLQCMKKHAFTSKREENAYVPTAKGLKLAMDIRLSLKKDEAEDGRKEPPPQPSPPLVHARAHAAGA